jgi:ATP-dependent Lon protease
MLRHNNLFSALPKAYYDTAFLDRLHAYLPGWEVKKLRNEMLTDGYGFIVDYLAEVLRELRKEDYSHLYTPFFSLPNGMTTRDRTAINKTFSGLMKLIFPDGKASKAEITEILSFALECRKRVKDQLVKMDETFEAVEFGFYDSENDNVFTPVECLEIVDFAFQDAQKTEKTLENAVYTEGSPETSEVQKIVVIDALKSGEHWVIKENQKGMSYQKLFARHLKGATHIHLFDPYLQQPYQLKNLMEFCLLLLDIVPTDSEIKLQIFTKYDEKDNFKSQKTQELLDRVCAAFDNTDLKVSYQFDLTPTFHARSIETDTGWKISLDRGLDIFQAYNITDVFALEHRRQEARACKAFEVTYLRV